ncbi:MAG: hypothetical protein ACRD8O_11185 [Bryobacteraceae bacterium]
MRVLVMALFAALAASAQSPVGGSPVQGIPTLKPGQLIFKPAHVHFGGGKCKGQPDRVYAKSFNTYYACIGGADVCSDEKGKIPRPLMEAFDAEMRAFDARMAQFKEEVERNKQARSQDPKLQALQARHEALLAEARQARAEGRRPNLHTLGGLASASAAPSGAVPMIESTPAPPPPSPIADERLKEIAAGTTRDEVVEKLGQPFMKMSGGVEFLTYKLESGKSARLEFENGKLARVQISPR